MADKVRVLGRLVCLRRALIVTAIFCFGWALLDLIDGRRTDYVLLVLVSLGSSYMSFRAPFGRVKP